MTAECSLCGCEEPDAGDVDSLLLDEYWPEDGHPDYLGLKRALEADYDLSLTVTEVRRHLDHHITYSFDVEKLDSLLAHREGGSP